MAPGMSWRLGLALGLAGCGGTEAVDSVSDWPDTGIPWSSTVSLVADGVVLQPGDVLEGASAPAGLSVEGRAWTLTLTNRGEAPLDFPTDASAWIDAPGFALEGAPASLAPEQSAAMTLRFDASSLTEATRTLAELSVPNTELSVTVDVEVPRPLRMVFLAHGGLTLTSDDYGQTVTMHPETDPGWNMRAITWAHGRFFRAGSTSLDWFSDGRYAWSADGVTWTAASAADDFWVTDCAWAFERFLCLRNSVFSWSENGTVVIHEATDWGQMLNAMVALPDRVVAVGRMGNRRISYDGTTFTGIFDFAEGDEIRAIAHHDGRLVSVGGTDRQVVSWSDDLGETWTDQVLYTAQYARLSSVAYGNGRWVIAGSGTNAWTSTDGQTWTQTGENAHLLGFAHGAFFASRFDYTARVDSLYRSEDGETWTQIASLPTELRLADLATETWP